MYPAPSLYGPHLRPHGFPYVRREAAPAAGAHFVFTVSGEFWIVLLALFVRLSTDATAANRTLRLEYRDDADNVYDVMGNPVTYPASTVSEDFAFSIFQPRGEWEVASANLVPLHPLPLSPTHDFRIFLNNIQAGDTLTLVRFVVQEFYSAAPSESGATMGG